MGNPLYGKDAGIAKILKRDKRDGSGQHGGMGILIDRRHVVTCAHVVNAAVGLPIEAVAKPTEAVPVAFPLWTRRDAINGRVVAWHPIGCGSVEDVAVLELEADAPVEIGTAYFAQLHRPLDRDPLNVFGIPAGHPSGNHVEARFMGPITGTGDQIDGTSQTGVFIRGGFSGGGVWDTVHEALIGMVRAIRTGNQIKVAYIIPTASLQSVWPDLPVEDRRLPASINWIWTAVTVLLLTLMMVTHIGVQTSPDDPELWAFFGMHAYALLAPAVALMWWFYARDYKWHRWAARIPRFASAQTDQNSTAQKALWVLSVLFLVLVPTYIQGYLLTVVHREGWVYIYPKRFGFEAQLDRRPDGTVKLKVGDVAYDCYDRSNILCKHPDATLYSTVRPGPAAPDPSWWETYWENAYHYGDRARDNQHGSVTFWPILQPVAVEGLSALAVAMFLATVIRLFRRRAA